MLETVGFIGLGNMGAEIVEEMSSEAMSRGWGDLDTNISFTLQEEAAGVQVRADVVVD